MSYDSLGLEWDNLIGHFRGVDWADRYQWLHEGSKPSSDILKQGVVQAPLTDTPYLAPYLPFVGPDYHPGGILILATAQNLQGVVSRVPDTWSRCVGRDEEEALWRLYYDSDLEDGNAPFEFQRNAEDIQRFTRLNVPIQPISDGLLLALAGVWELATGTGTGTGVDPRDEPNGSVLDGLLRRIAVTNFFKFSLRRGNADLNPGALGTALARRYVEQTYGDFVKKEIEVLKPGVILFLGSGRARRPIERLMKEAHPSATWVADPSWIKRGMSGMAGEGSSWHKRQELARNGPHWKGIEQLGIEVCAETSQLKGKSRPVEVYLGNYYQLFRSLRQ